MRRRLYQQTCLDKVTARHLAGVKRLLASLFTGAGKSIIFSALPEYMPSDKRMLLMTHTAELVSQAAAHLKRWNPTLDVGIEMADQQADDDHQIVVASVQSIGRGGSSRLRRFRPDEFDWLVVDEAHHSTAQTYRNVFEHFGVFNDGGNGPTLLGVTATPSRSDSQGLGQIYDEIVYQYGIRDGIKDGWLVEPRGYNIHINADYSGVSTRAGDFQQEELAKIVDTPECNDAIVREWIQYGWPRRTIAFTINVQHAKNLAYAFQKMSIPAEAVWGDDPRREEKLKDLRAGRLSVLTNCQILTEGYDDPGVSCIIMARPTKSQTVFIQSVGRGLRLDGVENLVSARQSQLIRPDTKTDCLIMCAAGVAGRHSLVTLPTLFGLPAKLDLKGRSVVQVAQEIEEALRTNPGLDINKIEDATKIKTYVEEMNLWEVHFDDAVKENSELQWHRGVENSYALLLPNKESMVVFENLLGKFNVVGSIKGQKFDEQGFDSLQAAFQYAEMNLSLHGKELITLLRRESRWMKGDVTEPQLRLLKKFHVPAHVIAGMDKGKAAKFLAAKFGGIK